MGGHLQGHLHITPRYAKWPHPQARDERAAILHNAALCYMALPQSPLEGDGGGDEPGAVRRVFALLCQAFNGPGVAGVSRRHTYALTNA